MGVIFALSHRSSVYGLGRVPDVATHGAAYLVLALLLAHGLTPGVRLSLRSALIVIAFATAYGATDEAHQSFIPGRHSDPWDVAKDALGAILGVAAYQHPKVHRGGDSHERPESEGAS